MEQPNIRLKDKHEIMVFGQLRALGYTVLNNGWPSFLAIRGGEVRLIEVRAPDTTGPTNRQLRIAEVLKTKGLTLEVAPGSLDGAKPYTEFPRFHTARI
jgi:hypothetical protein